MNICCYVVIKCKFSWILNNTYTKIPTLTLHLKLQTTRQPSDPAYPIQLYFSIAFKTPNIVYNFLIYYNYFYCLSSLLERDLPTKAGF